MTRSEARKSGLPDTVFPGSNYWFYSKFGPEQALARDSGAFPATKRSNGEPIVAGFRRPSSHAVAGLARHPFSG
jgi:hypothetical protein